ncbi:hypothetical protein KR054_008883 [Drosophila jambulina]|nr:hypothetical protein KR054_008883 [Drosophila jambulina]
MVLPTHFDLSCGSLFRSPLKFVCSGVVPLRYCMKYKCGHITMTAPYSIFQLEAQNSSYLLFFRYLKISKCRIIELLDRHNALCLNHPNKPKMLSFGFGHRECYNYSMPMTTDLIWNCANNYENDLLSGYYFVNSEIDPGIALLRASDRGCALLGSPILVLCLLISLVLVLCLRWSH